MDVCQWYYSLVLPNMYSTSLHCLPRICVQFVFNLLLEGQFVLSERPRYDFIVSSYTRPANIDLALYLTRQKYGTNTFKGRTMIALVSLLPP